MKRSGAGQASDSASQLIDRRIAELDDWRGELLGKLRALVKEVEPGILEEWKWRGTPVWSRDGIVCTGETYKSVVKMTFAKGAFLEDPAGLFNSSLEGNVRRAIDIREGEKVDTRALKALLRAAVALNVAGKSAKKKGATPTRSASSGDDEGSRPSKKKTAAKPTAARSASSANRKAAAPTKKKAATKRTARRSREDGRVAR